MWYLFLDNDTFVFILTEKTTHQHTNNIMRYSRILFKSRIFNISIGTGPCHIHVPHEAVLVVGGKTSHGKALGVHVLHVHTVVFILVSIIPKPHNAELHVWGTAVGGGEGHAD